MQLRFTFHALFIAAAVFCILTTGCEDDPLARADELITAYNFSAALEVLDELDEAGRGDVRFHRLRALSLLVEGRTDEGFEEIDSGCLTASDSRSDAAQILLDAAKIVVREKARYNEAIRLLDSCLAYDPDLKDEVLELSLVRGLEYLNVPGTGGYKLIQFAAGIDEKIPKQLRRRDRRLHRRYGEMDRMHKSLEAMAGAVEKYRESRNRLPHDMQELIRSGFTDRLGIFHKGWRIDYQPDTGDGFKVTAEALKNNPVEVAAGTILTYP